MGRGNRKTPTCEEKDWKNTDSSNETSHTLDGFEQGNYSRIGWIQARKLFHDWMDSSKETIPGLDRIKQGNYSKTGRLRARKLLTD